MYERSRVGSLSQHAYQLHQNEGEEILLETSSPGVEERKDLEREVSWLEERNARKVKMQSSGIGGVIVYSTFSLQDKNWPA